MRKLVLSLSVAAVCLAGLALASAALAGEITEKGSGVTFPDSIVLQDGGADITLSATGTGLRKKFVFKVYACVSYVDSAVDLGADPAATLIKVDAAKQVHMKFLRSVDHGKIVDAFEEGLKKNLGDQYEAIAPERKLFLEQFTKEIKDGDTLDLTYLPGRGLVTSQNGEELGVVPGSALARGLWSVYFGDHPVSKDMKKQMLELVGEADMEPEGQGDSGD